MEGFFEKLILAERWMLAEIAFSLILDISWSRLVPGELAAKKFSCLSKSTIYKLLIFVQLCITLHNNRSSAPKSPTSARNRW